jgi:hypothetical protein
MIRKPKKTANFIKKTQKYDKYTIGKGKMSQKIRIFAPAIYMSNDK